MADLIQSTDYFAASRMLPAWHGKGDLLERITYERALDRLGWDVFKVQLTDPETSEKLDTYATYRIVDNKRIYLGTKFAEGYTPLQNKTLLESIKPLINQGCEIETCGTLEDGKRIFVLLRLKGDLRCGKDDQIARYILASNDHAGRISARIGTTGIRVVCANTIAIADGEKSQLRLRHTENVNEAYQEAAKLIDAATGAFIAYGEIVDALASKAVNQIQLRELVKFVYAPKFDEKQLQSKNSAIVEKAMKDKERIDKYEEIIGSIFLSEPTITDVQATNGTLWGLYQSVNFFLNHGKKGSAEDRLNSLVYGQGALEDARAFNKAVALLKA